MVVEGECLSLRRVDVSVFFQSLGVGIEILLFWELCLGIFSRVG